MKLRVGQLHYLNALPLYLHLSEHTQNTLVPGCPRELNQWLHSGNLDVSLVSSWAYLQHQDEWTLLPHFCIASSGAVGSVFFYHRIPLSELHHKEIAISTESATSAQLLTILCRTVWHIAPQWIPLKSRSVATNYPAFLLIGDEALRTPRVEGYQTVDLAALWYQTTTLPLPFAVLAARRSIAHDSQDTMKRLLGELEVSLQWAETHPKELVKHGVQRSGLSEELLTAYFNRLAHRFSPLCLEGLRSFAALSGCQILEEKVLEEKR